MTQKPFQFTKSKKRDFKSPVRKKMGKMGTVEKKNQSYFMFGEESLWGLLVLMACKR